MSAKLHDHRPAFLKDKILSSDNISPRTCRMCPTQLAPNVKYYCSGYCMTLAVQDGTYGHEEDAEAQA